MKNVFCILILLFTSLLQAEINSLKTTSIVDTIFVGSEPDYPPFCLQDSQGEADGFSVDLLKAAASVMGLKIEFKVDSWNKIKQELAEGKIDVLPLVGRSPERELLYDFTFPYYSLHGAVFVNKKSKGINKLLDLKDKEILVMKGDNAEEFAIRENISSRIISKSTYREAFKALAAGEHDALIAQRLMGLQLLADLEINNVEPLDIELKSFAQSFCFAVPEGEKEMLAVLNEGLGIIIANGTYNELLEKWFTPDMQSLPSLAEVIKIVLAILIPALTLFSVVIISLLRKEVKGKTADLLRDIKRREVIEDELRSSNAKLRASDEKIINQNNFLNRVIESLNHPFYIINAKTYEVELANSACGFDLKTATKLCYQLTHQRNSPCTCSDHPCPLDIVKKTGKSTFAVHTHYDKNGEKVSYEVHAHPIFNEAGELIQIIEYSLDITERIQAAKSIEVARDKLRLLNKILRHDIANDFSVINSAVKIYKITSDSNMLDKISNRVNKSINTISDYKIYEESIRLGEGLIEIELLPFLDTIVLDFPEMKFNIKGNCTVLADDSLKSVFINLISNSIVHGSSTHINIDIQSFESICMIHFKDNGIGIREEAREKIFEEGFFYGNTGHTGIGLHIVKKTVLDYGGSIELLDNDLNGAAFEIKLRRSYN